MTKVEELKKYSNPREAQRKAYRYLGKKYGKIYPSSRREKKYMVQKPQTKNREFKFVINHLSGGRMNKYSSGSNSEESLSGGSVSELRST